MYINKTHSIRLISNCNAVWILPAALQCIVYDATGGVHLHIEFESLPIDGPLRITSPFGHRKTNITGASTNHQGIDLGRDFTKPNTNILAVSSGTISDIYWSDMRGWVIIIDHGHFKTLYQHLKSKPDFKVDETIFTGEIIGIMGASTKNIKNMAVHLHFELRVNDVPINPEPYLKDISDKQKRNEVNKVMRYKKIEELPQPLQSELKSLINCGALTGISKDNLDITEDMARMLIVSKRYTDNSLKI